MQVVIREPTWPRSFDPCRDKSLHVGSATCKTCSAGFQTVINCTRTHHYFYPICLHFVDLSEPIDVYSEWVDAINERDLKKKRRKIADDESAGSRTQASINHDSDADK